MLLEEDLQALRRVPRSVKVPRVVLFVDDEGVQDRVRHDIEDRHERPSAQGAEDPSGDHDRPRRLHIRRRRGVGEARRVRERQVGHECARHRHRAQTRDGEDPCHAVQDAHSDGVPGELGPGVRRRRAEIRGVHGDVHVGIVADVLDPLGEEVEQASASLRRATRDLVALGVVLRCEKHTDGPKDPEKGDQHGAVRQGAEVPGHRHPEALQQRQGRQARLGAAQEIVAAEVPDLRRVHQRKPCDGADQLVHPNYHEDVERQVIAFLLLVVEGPPDALRIRDGRPGADEI
mmetsp:Transcript_54136/g.156337  ORF Transcript_54136/g.156337 Transcript_54136/m.156337 type:complete len:289 (-) Transcript_54136:1218-2084(-)